MIKWNVDSFFSFHSKRTRSQEEQKSIFRQAKFFSMASLVMMLFSKKKKLVLLQSIISRRIRT
jgi:hypothetical protein